MPLLQSVPIQPLNSAHTYVTKSQWSLYQNIYTLDGENRGLRTVITRETLRTISRLGASSRGSVCARQTSQRGCGRDRTVMARWTEDALR